MPPWPDPTVTKLAASFRRFKADQTMQKEIQDFKSKNKIISKSVSIGSLD
jgi:hypothetical protein